MSTDLQLFQHIFESYLSSKRSSSLKEGLPQVLKLISSRNLLETCFESDEFSTAYPNLSPQWCDLLTKFLLPLEDGNIKEDFGTNVSVASQLILITVKQSSKAFNYGVKSWTRELLKCLTRVYLGQEILECVSASLSELIQQTKSFPTLEREITASILPQFNSQLITLFEDHSMNSVIFFDALYWSLRAFPKTFRPLSARFRQLLLDSWLSSSAQKSFLLQPKTSKLLAQKVFLCLSQLSLTERNSTAISESWSSTFSSLVSTGHSLLNILLSPLETEPYSKTSDSYTFKVSEHSIDKSSFYGLRFQNYLSQFILTSQAIVCFLNFRPSSFIDTPYYVPLQELMNLVCRVYSCNNSSSIPFKDDSSKNRLALLSILPTLYGATHDILIKLCRSLGSGMLEYCKLISDIIHKLLFFSQKHTIERQTTYSLIFHVIDGLGENILYHIIDALLVKTLDDLELKESKLSENVLSQASDSKKKKNTKIQETILSSKTTLSPNSNYYLAMNVLERCLRDSLIPIQAETRQKIDSLLFRQASLNISGELVLNQSQFFSLAKCLKTATLKPSPTQGILAENSIAIFSSLKSHYSHEIRQFATQALSAIDILIHPQLPHILIDNALYSSSAIKSYQELVSKASLSDPPVAIVQLEPSNKPVQMPKPEPTGNSNELDKDSAELEIDKAFSCSENNMVAPELKRPAVDFPLSPKRVQLDTSCNQNELIKSLEKSSFDASLSTVQNPDLDLPVKPTTDAFSRPSNIIYKHDDSDSDDEIPMIVS